MNGANLWSAWLLPNNELVEVKPYGHLQYFPLEWWDRLNDLEVYKKAYDLAYVKITLDNGVIYFRGLRQTLVRKHQKCKDIAEEFNAREVFEYAYE